MAGELHNALEQAAEPLTRKNRNQRWERGTNTWKNWKLTEINFRNTTPIWTISKTATLIPRQTKKSPLWEWRKNAIRNGEIKPIYNLQIATENSLSIILFSQIQLTPRPWYLSCYPLPTDMASWFTWWLQIQGTDLKRIIISFWKMGWKYMSNTTISTRNSCQDLNLDEEKRVNRGFLFAKNVRKPCRKHLHEGTYSSARPAEFVSTKQLFSRKETSVSCREKKSST